MTQLKKEDIRLDLHLEDGIKSSVGHCRLRDAMTTVVSPREPAGTKAAQRLIFIRAPTLQRSHLHIPAQGKRCSLTNPPDQLEGLRRKSVAAAFIKIPLSSKPEGATEAKDSSGVVENGPQTLESSPPQKSYKVSTHSDIPEELRLLEGRGQKEQKQLQSIRAQDRC